MPKKSHKKQSNKRHRTKRQKKNVMVGCSNKKSCKNRFFSLGGKLCNSCGRNCICSKQKGCPKCGPICTCSKQKGCSKCGRNCTCLKNCQKCGSKCTCNKSVKRGGANGCGSCGCPIAPYPMYGGLQYTNQPVLIDGKNDNKFIGIIGTAQNGGMCGSCGAQLNVMQSGGTTVKPLGPLPGPFIGSPWGTSLKSWPGIDGIGSDRNYLKNYENVIQNDPQQQMLTSDAGYLTKNSMVGGYTYKSRDSSVSSKKGGGLVPQDLVNLGRDFTFNLKSAYNALNGYPSPVDPAPYKGQLTGVLNNNKLII
jgi:hypothetical protein